MKKEILEAKKALERARELAKTTVSPLRGISLQEAIKRMRKIREELWEEKFAISARHK